MTVAARENRRATASNDGVPPERLKSKSRARARAFDERLFDDLEQPMMSPAPQKSVNISSVRACVLSSSAGSTTLLLLLQGIPVAARIPPTVVPVASSVVFFRPRFVCKDGHLTRILIKKVLFDSSGVRTHALSDENLNLAP